MRARQVASCRTAWRSSRRVLPFIGFLACGEVGTLDTGTFDAGNDTGRGGGHVDGASDAIRNDATLRPDARRDVALDSARMTVDAGRDVLVRLPDAATPDRFVPADTGHDVGVKLPDAGPPDRFAPADAGHDVGVRALDATAADHFVPADVGVDAVWSVDGHFNGPPDAEWLVDAAVDASSCATIAAALCARVAACPVRAGDTQLCMHVAPETLCVDSYADCVRLFTMCVPTASPPPSELTLIPDPTACAAALESDNCTPMGADDDFFVPVSCAVCPQPWEGPEPCPLNIGDAG